MIIHYDRLFGPTPTTPPPPHKLGLGNSNSWVYGNHQFIDFLAHTKDILCIKAVVLVSLTGKRISIRWLRRGGGVEILSCL